MKRLLPMPAMSLALFALWLLLNRSLNPGHLLLALAVAIVMPLLSAPLRPHAGAVRRPLVVARFILLVGWDVILSAVDVARGILHAGRRAPHSVFIVIPLDLRNENALAALAVIATVIPGTVWCELAPDRSALMLHMFDLDDEAAFIARFKTRYEGPLKEIFE